MDEPNGPVLVTKSAGEYYTKPGVHSRNVTRRIGRVSRTLRGVKRVQVLLFAVGICALGYYGYTLSDQLIYQAYQNWAFDQKIDGRSDVDFRDYLRERTPFGFLAGARTEKSAVSATAVNRQPAPEAPVGNLPVNGATLGRVAIPRLNLSAIVREGVDAKTLSIAVGHVPSTSLPGRSGNFAIAAHRDTLFRALKDIQMGDTVNFEAPDGHYTYQVVATKIVRPSDVSVLRADGGGLIPVENLGGSGQSKLLTMITCYPFYYVGSAPKRFIVEAKLISEVHPAQTEVARTDHLAPPNAHEEAPRVEEAGAAAAVPRKPLKRVSVSSHRLQRSSFSAKSSHKHGAKSATAQKHSRSAS